MLRKFGETHAEVAADVDDVRQQRLEDIEKFEGDAAGQRSAAEGGAVHAAADGGRGAFVGGDDAQRNAAGDRLGGDHDVGQNRRVEHLIGEVRSGAADAALDFVEDQQRVVPIGQLARLAHVLGGHRKNAAFALHQFEHDGRGACRTPVASSAVDVVAGDEVNAGEERFEIAAVFFLAGDGEGAEGAAVERIFERDRPRFFVDRSCGRARAPF